KIKIKNLLGLIDNPTYEDLLFEIVTFLEKEGRLEDEFIKQEVSLKTRCRIEENLDADLKKLQELGYIEHRGWTKWKLLKHPWK
ncbi:MAG TPA: hypothetical protein P5513_05710, partial [Candidatus Diapherotrites archaeon]|nr:hypothetical protein [Candidatus Diapherotrites archaeon]